MTNASFFIGRKRLGNGAPCYVIAEIGSNHDGKFSQAIKLVKAAAKAGADAVKFQSLRYDALWIPELESAKHRRFHSQLDLPESWYRPLKEACDDAGLHFLSCPTYPEAVELLAATGAPALKIASPQTRANLPLVRHAAASGLPLIVSTGYCRYSHVAAAMEACRDAGNRRVALLQCVSEYPARPEILNLRAMETMSRMFGVPAGFSDHTLGATAAVAAAALGAAVLEKHLTLDRDLPGPDHSFATEPSEFAAMVRGIREAEAMLGDGVKTPTPAEEKFAGRLQLRLIATRRIPAGAKLRRTDVLLRRGSFGLTPDDGWVFELPLARPLEARTPLEARHFRALR